MFPLTDVLVGEPRWPVRLPPGQARGSATERGQRLLSLLPRGAFYSTRFAMYHWRSRSSVAAPVAA